MAANRNYIANSNPAGSRESSIINKRKFHIVRDKFVITLGGGRTWHCQGNIKDHNFTIIETKERNNNKLIAKVSRTTHNNDQYVVDIEEHESKHAALVLMLVLGLEEMCG